MKLWEVQDAWGIDNLKMVEQPDPAAPGAGQILVRLHAGALNYRDFVTVTNKTPFGKLPQIPLSDAAGEVVALGQGVTRFKVGDTVCPRFFRDWDSGNPSMDNRKQGRGSAATPGVLQTMLVDDAETFSLAPKGWSFLEASTLPCAALTAWRALVVEAQMKAGDTVLVQGTGGVSIFALQIAKMMGATVIATSSSDEKLERVKALGADHVINYRETPEWGKAAMEITGGRGVNHVVEVGGAGTINQSIAAAGVYSNIVIIGVLGGRSQELLMPAIFGKGLRLLGISVGSRDHFEDMVRAIDDKGLKPVIGQTFPFAEVPEAFRMMEAAGHFGKICIDYDA